MDQIMGKVGGYWFSQQAGKEMNNVGDDLNVVSTYLGVDFTSRSSFHSSRYSETTDYSPQPIYGVTDVHRFTGSLIVTIGRDQTFFAESVNRQIFYQNFVERKGKMQKPLPEFLKEYDLPMGLFPQDATNYEFDEETKKLTVYIASACEVGYKDSSVLRFFTCVTGNLDKGKLSEVEGMKTKILIWIKVTAVRTEASKVHFCVGMNKTRDRDAYEVVRDGVSIDKF